MHHKCRKACGQCTVAPAAAVGIAFDPPPPLIAKPGVPMFGMEPPPIAPVVIASAPLILAKRADQIDPYTAQMKYGSGTLPDPPLEREGACGLNNLPNGELLARVELGSNI